MKKTSKSDKYEKILRIAVRFQTGTIIMMDGRPIPKLKTDTIGELFIPADSIVDPDERARLTGEVELPFIGKNTEIYLSMSTNADLSQMDNSKLLKAHPSRAGFRLIPVLIKQDLNLLIRGDDKARLADCQCEIPGLHKLASSVNHAYTVISEVLEPRRRSHTANVFQQAFVLREGRFRTFDDIRKETVGNLRAQQKTTTSAAKL